MSGYYIYLISSLPMLHFGNPPPFSFERLIQMCEGIISVEDINILKITAKGMDYAYDGSQPTLKKWFVFEVALRNELVKIRASRKHMDPQRYLRLSDNTEPYISRIALAASRIPSIIDAEMMLDQERWQQLEELSLGHFFDIDCLIIYGLKLLILERWDRIRTADKTRMLEETLSKANN